MNNFPLEKIKNLTLQNIAGSEELILLNWKPKVHYNDTGEKTDSVDGYIGEFICVSNGFEKLKVKLLKKPEISQEDIDASENAIYCSLEEFIPKIYRNFKNNTYGITFTAKSVVLLK